MSAAAGSYRETTKTVMVPMTVSTKSANQPTYTDQCSWGFTRMGGENATMNDGSDNSNDNNRRIYGEKTMRRRWFGELCPVVEKKPNYRSTIGLSRAMQSFNPSIPLALHADSAIQTSFSRVAAI